MLNWKSLGFGIALAIVMFFMFMFNAPYLAILSFIIAPLVGTYILGGELKVAGIYGAAISFFGSIISIVLYAALISYFSGVAIPLGLNVVTLIAVCVIYAIIGAVCGIVGAAIKNKLMEKQ